ncbi:MAG: MerR family transcriptional regulator [Myxococcales bacterium]|nr:MerR family transcriptional regulator [Myxococcales bacterium]
MPERPPPPCPAAPPADADHVTIDDLALTSGESRRTIRYYMLNGLLAGPSGQGPAARYPAGHVDRLRLIRRMQDQGLQLSTIRDALDRLDDGSVRSALSAPVAMPSAPAAASGPREGPVGSARSQWERFELDIGVELHVRRPLPVSANRRVQRLLEYAEKLRLGKTSSDDDTGR